MDGKPLLVVLEPAGRPLWPENELYDQLASQGCAVCAADIRGIGDMTPEFGRASARYAGSHHAEEDWAWSSLILGKPLLGQRVTDLLSVVFALRARADLRGRRIVVAARESLTVPALFAGVLDRSIDALYLSGGLVSFQNFTDTENYSYPFANIVPNLLKYTDLPDLTATMAPRRVILAGMIDATGKKMTPDEVQNEYRQVANVRILPDPSWTMAGILGAFGD
jgi:hypothetical protein